MNRRLKSKTWLFLLLLIISGFFSITQAYASPTSMTLKDVLQEDAYRDDGLAEGYAYPVDETYRLAFTDSLCTGTIKVNYVGGNVNNFGLQSQQSAIKFDISSISGTIHSAGLKIHTIDAENSPVVNLISTTDNTWTQTSQEFPSYSSSDIINSYSNVSVTANTDMTFDVAAHLQGIIDGGSSNISFVLTGTEGGDQFFNFVSNLESVNTSWRPELSISYTPAAGAPAVTGTTPTNDTTPTWSWTSGSNGNGDFRYKLDDSDLSSGAVETTSTSFAPESALSEGSHTLYVQESNGATPERWSAAGSRTIVVDTTPPTGGIISINGGANYTNSTAATLTLSATDAAQMMISEDSGFVGASYEAYATSKIFTLSSGDGEKTVYVKYKDAAGNESGAVSDTITLDTQTPTASISSTVPNPTNTTSIPVTITFSESVTGFDTGDITVGNGTKSDFSGSGTTYTVNITPSADGAVTVNVAGGVAQDAAGNNNTAATQLSRTYDVTRPIVTLSSTAANPTNISPIPVTITFSESVTGFDDSDIAVTNGTKSDFSGSGTTYTVNITPSADGAVTVDVAANVAQDAVGNENTAATQLSRTYDTQPPTGGSVSINSGADYALNAAATLTLSATDAAQMIISEDSGFVGASYEAYATSKNFTLSSGDGTKTVYVKFKDVAGNETSAVSDTILLDTQAPTVALSSTAPNLTNTAPIPVTITFSESVTGFDAGDITVGNGSASEFAGSGTTYTVNITPSADGAVTVDVAANVAQDAVGNENTAATQLSRTYDTQPPTGGTISINGGADYALNAAATLTLSATDAAQMIISEDSGFVGASYEAYATSKNFTLSSGDGEKTVYVKYKDAAGNESGAVSDTITLDTQTPTASISSTVPNPTNTTSIPVTITFSESVTGFDVGDITVGNGSANEFAGSGTTYTVNITPSADGAVTVNVAGGVAQDAAGNNNTAATQLSRTYDVTRPIVTLSSTTANPTNISPIPVTITFSESVTGFDDSDIAVTNGTISGFSGSGTTYTVNITPAADGAVTVDVATDAAQDSVGNTNTAATQLSRTYDSQPPTGGTISINGGADYALNAAATLTLSATDAAQMIISESSGFVGASYVAYATSKNFTLSSGDGTKTVYVKFKDVAGNETSAIGDTILLDTQTPTVTLSSTAPNLTNTAPIPVTITFSESVTGFDVGDITVGNGSASEFAGSGATYTVNITPSADGAVTVDVAANVAQDAAGNNNTAATQLSRTYGQMYTVNYYYNCGTEDVYTSQSAISGSILTAPATNPVRPGYIFAGWYKEEACVNQWTFASDKTTGATNLYAKWTAKTAASITETTQTFTYDGSIKAFAINGTPNTGYAITYNQGSGDVTPTNAGTYNVVITRTEDETYAAYSKTITGGLVINPAVTSASAIAGVTTPVRGAVPVAAITETAQYTGTVTWNPAVTGIFAASTEYTATISLTAKPGYILTGVAADFFTVAGATSVTNEADSGIITAVFPATGAASSGGGGGSSTTPTNQTQITADVTIGGAGSTLPVSVDTNNGTASVDAGSVSLAQSGTIITIPSIPDVDTYKVGIPVPSLSAAEEQGSLTLDSAVGSVTVPSNMLTGVAGVSGSKAEITIGQGDKSTLPEYVKAAIGEKPLVQLTLSIDGRQTDWSNPDAPVTVSIPYTPTATELLNPESIVVWYIDGSGNVVTIPNGRYDAVTGKITFNTMHFSDYAVAYNKVSFNDVAAGSWYNKAVSFIAAREITSGTGDGTTYSPDAKLTRGEFIVLMMRAYGIAPDAYPTDNFSDAGNTYYTGYLAAAKRLGVTAGVGNNMYAPGNQITRQEMFTLLYNALNVIGQLPTGDSSKTVSDFTDAMQISSWAKDAMTLLVKTGTVGGSGGELTPTGTTTRAEMAQVLYNLLGK